MRAKRSYPTAAQLKRGPVYVDGYRIALTLLARQRVQYVIRQIETGEEHREGSIRAAVEYARRSARSHRHPKSGRLPWSILPPPSEQKKGES